MIKFRKYKGYLIWFNKWKELNRKSKVFGEEGYRFNIKKEGAPLKKKLYTRFADEDELYATKGEAFNGAKRLLNRWIKEGKI